MESILFVELEKVLKVLIKNEKLKMKDRYQGNFEMKGMKKYE